MQQYAQHLDWNLLVVTVTLWSILVLWVWTIQQGSATKLPESPKKPAPTQALSLEQFIKLAASMSPCTIEAWPSKEVFCVPPSYATAPEDDPILQTYATISAVSCAKDRACIYKELVADTSYGAPENRSFLDAGRIEQVEEEAIARASELKAEVTEKLCSRGT